MEEQIQLKDKTKTEDHKTQEEREVIIGFPGEELEVAEVVKVVVMEKKGADFKI